jgi:hypothetical protein
MTIAEVRRSVSIAGKAMLTMDSSMLAMLDARIDATSTQRLASVERFTAKDVERMTPSAHGLVLEEDNAIGIPNSITQAGDN